MSAFQGWTPPPGVAVVAPPVRCKVLTMWSDGSIDEEPTPAGDLNWSSYGEGPSIVAYAVVREYKTAPEPREWWLVFWGTETRGGRAVCMSLEEAQAMVCQVRGWSIIHVREVPDPSREVVAWAVVGSITTMYFTYEHQALEAQSQYGGTVRPLGFLP